jgi:hypothetical protein
VQLAASYKYNGNDLRVRCSVNFKLLPEDVAFGCFLNLVSPDGHCLGFFFLEFTFISYYKIYTVDTKVRTYQSSRIRDVRISVSRINKYTMQIVDNVKRRMDLSKCASHIPCVHKVPSGF